jgi:1-acyl-sn-glycerol-3-phosphate acyltransferase
MTTKTADEVPASVPRAFPRWLRWIARHWLRLLGWRLEGMFPDAKQLLIVIAPHSSAWDALYGLLIKISLGVDIRFMAKREVFWFPLGLLLKGLGAIPIDRRAAHGVVGETVAGFRNNPNAWFLLAPEGTRKAVKQWKSGFWHIARQAQVPVCVMYIHYPEKCFGVIDGLFQMTEDMDGDIAKIRALLAPYQGKHRGVC